MELEERGELEEKMELKKTQKSARIGGIEDCDDEFGNAEVGNGGGTDDTGRVDGRAERGRGGDLTFKGTDGSGVDIDEDTPGSG